MGHLKSNPEQLHRRRETTTAPVLRHPQNTKPGDGFTLLPSCGIMNGRYNLMTTNSTTQEVLMASGPQLRALREALNITGRQLAEELGRHPMTIKFRESKAEVAERIVQEHVDGLNRINAKREARARRMVDEL